MKNLTLGILLGFALTGSIAMRSYYEVKKNTAEVEQFQGLFVFTDSKPVSEYQYLGSVKIVLKLNGEYQAIRDKLIKNCKKEYPEADGLIMHFANNGVDRADAIKLK
jgi:hypothetical protein